MPSARSAVRPAPPGGLSGRAAALSSALALVAALALPAGARAQPPAPPRPAADSIRRVMVLPSRGAVRGRIDSTAYALHPAQMAVAWERSLLPPGPDSLGPAPAAGVAGIVCPHDDFSFAGRVYRRVVPLLTARTVVLFGVFHAYRKFGEHDRVVFDSYASWTAPDGPVPVSGLREALLARLPREDWTQDSTAHDAEHSLEPLVCWLRHETPGLEIVPIVVPASPFERLETLADHLAAALRAEMAARRWVLGRDLAIAISADGIHYGPDFQQETFGAGGPAAYRQAVAKDHALLQGPMRGPLTVANLRALYGTFVDPAHPDTYRWTWCGRFSVPLGLLVLERLGRDAGGARGWPVAYGTSVGWPEVGLRDLGMAPGAPSSLYHFVGYPGLAVTIGTR